MSGLSGDPPESIDHEIGQLQAELARPATYREPSAAERTQGAARVQPARRMGWRAARKARKLRKPVAQAGRPAPPARSSPRRPDRARPDRARRRRLLRYTAGLVAAAALGVTAYYVIPGLARSRGISDQVPGATTTTQSDLPAPTVATPFRGTPAQSWANGASGLVIPPPPPAGSLFPYTTTQITAAYQTTKQLLIAANLNQQTLTGGAPDAFASLLTPQQRTAFLTGLNKTGVNAQHVATSTRGWVTSFTRGTRLAGKVIKVHGIMSVSIGTNNGSSVLVVHADYLFVYR